MWQTIIGLITPPQEYHFCPQTHIWIVFVIIPLAILFVIFATIMAFLAHQKRVETGAEGIIGEIGEVTDEIAEKSIGKVFVHGEIWNARSKSRLTQGTQVKIVRVERMILWVESFQG